MKLTPEQKLQALAHRFYYEQEWDPQPDDLYTTSRDDLELYRIVNVTDDKIITAYTENSVRQSTWPASEFLTTGFGPKRVWVPDWIINTEPSE